MANAGGWAQSARYGSADELAAYSGLSSKTIRRLVKAGTVPGRRVGRRVLIAFEDLDSRVLKVDSAGPPPHRASSSVDASGRATALGPREARERAAAAIRAMESLDGLGDDREQARTLEALLEGLGCRGGRR